MKYIPVQWKIIFLPLLSVISFHNLFAQSPSFELSARERKILSMKDDKAKCDSIRRIEDVYYASDLNKYLYFINQKLKVRRLMGDSNEVALIYCDMGGTYSDMGDFKNARNYLYKATMLGRKLKNKKCEANALHNIGSIYLNSNNIDSARFFLKQSMKISEANKLCDIYLSAIENYALTFDNYDSTIFYHKKALEGAKHLKDSDLFAGVILGNIANLYSEKGKSYDSVFKYLNEAIAISERVNNQKQLGYDYLAMGTAFYEQRFQDKAILYFQKAFKTFKKLNDASGMKTTLNYLCSNFAYVDQFDSAKFYLKIYEKLVPLSAEGNEFDLANVKVLKGDIYSKEGLYDEALKNLFESLKLFRKLNYDHYRVTTYNSIAFCLAKIGRYDEALVYNDSCKKIVLNQTNLTLIAQCYNVYIDIYLGKQDYKRAYRSRKEYDIYKDSITNEKNSLAINDLNIKYETDKKNLLIAALNVEQQQQKKINSIILIAASSFIIIVSLMFYFIYRNNRLRNKYKLQDTEHRLLRSQMNPHFISNALSSIRSYMNEHPDEADRYLGKFSWLMRQILNHSSKTSITLSEEIETLKTYIDLEKLRLDFDCEIVIDESVNTDTEVPPLILQPIVENAIHRGLANKEGDKKLKIKITQKNNLLEYIIEDNGIGRDKAAALKAGQAVERQSHGARILKERLNILADDAKTKSSFNIFDLHEGTKVEILIPVKIS